MSLWRIDWLPESQVRVEDELGIANAMKDVKYHLNELDGEHNPPKKRMSNFEKSIFSGGLESALQSG